MIATSNVQVAHVRIPPTTFLVLPHSPWPIIIGLRTIKMHRLTRVFDKYFTTVPDSQTSHSSELLLAQAVPVATPEASHPGHTWWTDPLLLAAQSDVDHPVLGEGEEDALPPTPYAATVDRSGELTRAGITYIVIST